MQTRSASKIIVSKEFEDPLIYNFIQELKYLLILIEKSNSKIEKIKKVGEIYKKINSNIEYFVKYYKNEHTFVTNRLIIISYNKSIEILEELKNLNFPTDLQLLNSVTKLLLNTNKKLFKLILKIKNNDLLPVIIKQKNNYNLRMREK